MAAVAMAEETTFEDDEFRREVRARMISHQKWLRGAAGGQRAELKNIDLYGWRLPKIALARADLRAICLGRADLHGADLSGANLMLADLEDCDLTGANLVGADLRGARLDGADLRGAILDDIHRKPEDDANKAAEEFISTGGVY